MHGGPADRGPTLPAVALHTFGILIVGANPSGPWPMGAPEGAGPSLRGPAEPHPGLLPGCPRRYRGCAGLRAPPAPGHPEGPGPARREPQHRASGLAQAPGSPGDNLGSEGTPGCCRPGLSCREPAWHGRCVHGQGLLWSLCLWEHRELRAELGTDPRPGPATPCSRSGPGAGARGPPGSAPDGSLQAPQGTAAGSRTLPSAGFIPFNLPLCTRARLVPSHG